METMSRIVKGYRDRIQRGGGSVVVSAAGAIVGNLVNTGALALIASQIGIWDDPAGLRTVIQSGRSKLDLLTASGGSWAALKAGNIEANGTVTANGTGTHQFSGPVKVATNAYIGATGTTDANIFYTQDNAVRLRGRVVGTNADYVLSVATGAAGSETYTEALRIVNANAYVSVATRLGIGTASPAQPLHVVGNAIAGNNVGVNVGPAATINLRVSASATGNNAALLEQTVANATVPVLVVKAGATPGVGGDLAQFQDSNGASKCRIASDGGLYTSGWLVMSGSPVISMVNRAVAPGNAGAGGINIWYDDTAKALKFIDSVGTIKTIQAA